jgi:hypothetical protein
LCEWRLREDAIDRFCGNDVSGIREHDGNFSVCAT